MDKPRVFISFAVEDRDLAVRLFRDLTRHGADVFQFEHSATPGRQAWSEIAEWIASADVFVVLVSEDSLASAPVRAEVELAYHGWVNRREDRYLIPLLVEPGLQPPALLRTFSTISMDPYDDGLERLLLAPGLDTATEPDDDPRVPPPAPSPPPPTKPPWRMILPALALVIALIAGWWLWPRETSDDLSEHQGILVEVPPIDSDPDTTEDETPTDPTPTDPTPTPPPPSTPELTPTEGPNGWALINDSPGWAARGEHQAVVWKRRIWVLGGDAGSGDLRARDRYRAMNDLWASADGARWTRVEPTSSNMWSPRRAHAAVVFDDKLWVFGGEDPASKHHFNDVWYTPDGVNWRRYMDEAPWEPRRGHTVTVYRNRLWLLGGVTESRVLDDIWVSTDGREWVAVHNTRERTTGSKETNFSPWKARNSHCAVSFDDTLWLLAGGIDDVWTTTSGRDWRQVHRGAPWRARSGPSCVVADGAIWVLAGNLGRSKMADLWNSNDGQLWQAINTPSGWDGRRGQDAVVVNNKIFVLGGRTDRGSVAEVWSLNLSRATPEALH